MMHPKIRVTTLATLVIVMPMGLAAQPADTVVVTMNHDCAVGYVNLFGAHFGLGPDCAEYTGPNSCPTGSGPVNGVGPNWRGANAVGWLIGRFEELYDLGIRKIMINRPMGGSGVSHVTGAAWLTMPEYKREQLAGQLQPWLAAHPDLILGIFIGSRWIAPDSLMGYRTDMGPYPGTTSGFDPLIPAEIDAWHQVTDPWWDIGVRWVVLDAASQPANRDWFLRLAAYEADLRGVELTAEAITGSAPHHAQASWIALAPAFIEHPSRPHTNAGPAALADAPTTWYAWLQLSGLADAYASGHISSDDPQAYIQSVIARGYVPVATAAEFVAYPELLAMLENCDDLPTSRIEHADGTHGESVMIHPNPADGSITIATPTWSTGYVMHNALGKRIRSGTLMGGTTTIDISNAGPGLYFLMIGERTFRVVKQ